MKLSDYSTLSRWDYENGFNLTSHPTRIMKIVAHWELYKRIIHLPGHVVELGVFKGASLIRWATFRDALESPWSRQIIGFDVFGEFPAGKKEPDRTFVENWKKGAGTALSRTDMDSILRRKGFSNCELVEGDILSTVPAYLQKQPQLKIALLHLDTDIYEPARAALAHLWPHVVTGGLVVSDDYGTEYGGTRAMDEFLEHQPFKLEKFSFSHASPVYFVKDAQGY